MMFLSSALAGAAPANSQVPLSLSVANVQLVEHDKGGYLSMDLKLVNTNPNKKVDLTQAPEVRLTDDFGNTYHLLSSSSQDQKELPRSLYPNDFHVFSMNFEQPLSSVKKLKLAVELSSAGLTAPAIVPVDLPQETVEVAMEIISPRNGAIVEAGRLVHLVVESPSGKVPERIIVNGLDTTFEDADPAQHNVYDLNVPLDVPAGNLSITVIGQRRAPDNQLLTASDTVVVTVSSARLFSEL